MENPFKEDVPIGQEEGKRLFEELRQKLDHPELIDDLPPKELYQQPPLLDVDIEDKENPKLENRSPKLFTTGADAMAKWQERQDDK